MRRKRTLKDIARILSSLKWILLGVIVIIASVVAYSVYHKVKSADVSVKISSDSTINVTPERVSEIKRIGQWEFMSVVDEQVIDTVRHFVLVPDHQMTCIYRGTLRLGIDLGWASDDWVVNHGDTVVVTLPQPRLLDDNFIDEARTVVFYERGRWGAAAKEQMYRRARQRMKANALTPENLTAVRQMATRRFESLFLSMGAKKVEVKFE